MEIWRRLFFCTAWSFLSFHLKFFLTCFYCVIPSVQNSCKWLIHAPAFISSPDLAGAGPGCATQAQGKQVSITAALHSVGWSEFPGCHGLCVPVCHIHNLHLHKLPYRRNDRVKHMTNQFQPLTLKTASTLTLTISKVQNFKIKPMFFVMPAQVPGV